MCVSSHKRSNKLHRKRGPIFHSSGDDLSPLGCQVITWNHVGLLPIGPLGTNVSDTGINVQKYCGKCVWQFLLQNGGHIFSGLNVPHWTHKSTNQPYTNVWCPIAKQIYVTPAVQVLTENIFQMSVRLTFACTWMDVFLAWLSWTRFIENTHKPRG